MCWRPQPYVLEPATLCVLQVKRREMLEHHAFDREAPRPFKQECYLVITPRGAAPLHAGVLPSYHP